MLTRTYCRFRVFLKKLTRHEQNLVNQEDARLPYHKNITLKVSVKCCTGDSYLLEFHHPHWFVKIEIKDGMWKKTVKRRPKNFMIHHFFLKQGESSFLNNMIFCNPRGRVQLNFFIFILFLFITTCYTDCVFFNFLMFTIIFIYCISVVY